MTTADRLRALYEKAQSELCPCRGYENSIWLDGVAFQELIAVVESADAWLTLSTYDGGTYATQHIATATALGDALAALDAALGGGE